MCKYRRFQSERTGNSAKLTKIWKPLARTGTPKYSYQVKSKSQTTYLEGVSSIYAGVFHQAPAQKSRNPPNIPNRMRFGEPMRTWYTYRCYASLINWVRFGRYVNYIIYIYIFKTVRHTEAPLGACTLSPLWIKSAWKCAPGRGGELTLRAVLYATSNFCVIGCIR